MYENERPVEQAGYLTDEISARAVAFIDRHAGGPFFLDVAYNATHWPFQPPNLRSPPPYPSGTPDEVIDRWAAKGTRQDYVRMLERADEGIGKILEALHRHRLTQNTLVIFASDNGGEWLSRNEPLFHRKGSLWEGGLRVPCLLRWPQRLPAGRVSGQPAITMDLTATILAAAGVQIPADRRLDGIDLVPILIGASPEAERTFFWRVTVQGRQDKAVRHGRWKYVSGSRFPGLLFDVGSDPSERKDLAYRQPEMLARLKAMHADWEREVTRR